MKTIAKIQHARQAEAGSLRDTGKLLEELANPSGPAQLNAVTVANAPPAAEYLGCILYVSNGAAGAPILAFSDGTNWKRSDTGATIASA